MTGYSLTPRQQVVMAFLQRYNAQTGTMPTYDEIAAGTGTSSKSGVHSAITRLVERGHIERIPGRVRAIRIIGTSAGESHSTIGERSE